VFAKQNEDDPIGQEGEEDEEIDSKELEDEDIDRYFDDVEKDGSSSSDEDNMMLGEDEGSEEVPQFSKTSGELF
jgi:hypothetical protein